MAKSLIAIGVLGAAGCLVLSVGMQRLLDMDQQRKRSPLELELEAQFERRLAGPVRVDAAAAEVRLRVLAGLGKRRIAEAVAAAFWRHGLQAGQPLRDLQVIVQDDEGGEERFVMPPPARRR